jgi:hypothetical protein
MAYIAGSFFPGILVSYLGITHIRAWLRCLVPPRDCSVCGARVVSSVPDRRMIADLSVPFVIAKIRTGSLDLKPISVMIGQYSTSS